MATIQTDNNLDVLLESRMKLREIMQSIGDLVLPGVSFAKISPNDINSYVYQLAKEVDREIGLKIHHIQVDGRDETDDPINT